ncbi:MAG: Uncharacterised protein [Opitutia bacterium UBA7350]|nr:MAG: Uncharacterised protein [Opitutae bacterium UBA7350]
MKRPQQKKNKNLFPETQEEAATIDERNLVDAENTSDIAFEERVSMYWMENKGFVTGCILALALVIIGLNGVRIYGNYTSEKQQSLYLEALANDSLESFATDYPTLELGGFAALQVADAAFEAAEYDRAKENYARAMTALESPMLKSRARLGLAFANKETGDTAAAQAEMEALIAEPTTADSIRAEALYYLALTAHLEAKENVFANLAEQMSKLTPASPWQQRLEQLR